MRARVRAMSVGTHEREDVGKGTQGTTSGRGWFKGRKATKHRSYQRGAVLRVLVRNRRTNQLEKASSEV